MNIITTAHGLYHIWLAPQYFINVLSKNIDGTFEKMFLWNAFTMCNASAVTTGGIREDGE